MSAPLAAAVRRPAAAPTDAPGAPGAARSAAGERPIRVLLFSTLYPSATRPGHGLFVETRLRELMKSGVVDARVVAPVPWFPSTNPRFGAWAKLAATPARETRNGLDVQHPRYALPPKVGQHVAPLALALGALPAVRRLRREGFVPELIDAHYFYPDGVAAALLGRWLGLPVTMTARGSDVHVIGRHPLSRRMMRWAAGRAEAAIGVCRALTDAMAGWGVEAARLQVIRNGVDLQRFHPVPPAEARAAVGETGAPLVLAVGNLVPVKGHALLIDAFALLRRRHPGARLCLVGDGPLRGALQAQAEARGVADAVRFVGPVPNDRLAPWYSAADLLVLPSHSEGWANVLLEAMACGTPVVATDVGGSGEVLGDGGVGVLVPDREPATMAACMDKLLDARIDRALVRAYAEGFGWDHATDAQLALFRRITGRPVPTTTTP